MGQEDARETLCLGSWSRFMTIVSLSWYSQLTTWRRKLLPTHRRYFNPFQIYINFKLFSNPYTCDTLIYVLYSVIMLSVLPYI